MAAKAVINVSKLPINYAKDTKRHTSRTCLLGYWSPQYKIVGFLTASFLFLVLTFFANKISEVLTHSFSTKKIAYVLLLTKCEKWYVIQTVSFKRFWGSRELIRYRQISCCFFFTITINAQESIVFNQRINP